MPRSLRRSRILSPTCASIGRTRAVSSWTVLRLILVTRWPEIENIRAQAALENRATNSTTHGCRHQGPGVATEPRSPHAHRAPKTSGAPLCPVCGVGGAHAQTAARQPNVVDNAKFALSQIRDVCYLAP